MIFTTKSDRIYAENDESKVVAEVTFPACAEGVVSIDHTYVDDALRGQGIAGQLMEMVYSLLKADGRKAKLVCPYAIKWYREHPENNDIVDEK